MGWLDLEPSVGWTLLALGALLAAATVIVWALQKRRPGRDWSELRQRIGSWWIMLAVFGLAMVIAPWAAVLLFAFISFLGLKEYLSLIPTRRADRRVLFWAYLAIPIQYYWVYDEWYGMFIIFIPVYMFLLLPLRMMLIGQTEGFLRAAGTLHWGLMTIVYCLSHAAFLLVLRLQENPENAIGPGLFLYVVALTQLNDVLQFVWGRTLGRHKIVPAVSPKKTWEGFLGGAATTLALAVLLGPVLTPMNRLQSVGAGLIIGIGGFVGDVTISLLKRDLQIKDTGTLLPGHGGILDRVDSLTYTAPLFFHYVYWLFLFQTHGA